MNSGLLYSCMGSIIPPAPVQGVDWRVCRKSASHRCAVRKGRGTSLASADSCGILFGCYVKTWQSGGFSKVSLQCSLKPYQGAFYSLWFENPSVYLVLWMDHFHMHDFVTSVGKHELCSSLKCWPIHFTISKKKKSNSIIPPISSEKSVCTGKLSWLPLWVKVFQLLFLCDILNFSLGNKYH